MAEKNKSVLIVGAGASGMVCGIAASRNGAKVTLLEHNDRVGKKILSTGNGKCNYTNQKQGNAYYRGENPAFVLPALRQFSFSDTLLFFRGLGIYPKIKNGGFYPVSGQASAVLDVLRMELDFLGVEIYTECKIQNIQRKKEIFEISSNVGRFYGESCVIACGGLAFPKSGSDGSAFPYIEKLGHHFIDMVPALVQLKSKQSFFKSLAGIRADAVVKLYVQKKQICQDIGEIQLTDYGISGIPTFQVSRYAARALKKGKLVEAVLDFLPELSSGELLDELKDRFYSYPKKKSVQDALIGLFHKKLIPVLLKNAGIEPSWLCGMLGKEHLEKLIREIKSFRIDITGTKGFENAQVSAGGVDTSEINPDTLESKLVPGLYFAGEVLDIDGMCGGYNLQWAWSSGYTAGLHAAGQGKGEEHDSYSTAEAPAKAYKRGFDKKGCKKAEII